MQVAERYFDAWNRRDAEAIVASFASGGTYSDPSAGENLQGDAIAAYARGLWAAFPDLSFATASAADDGAGLISAQWIMRGTNTGSMLGLPPTGRSVTLAGADFIQVEGDRIRSVRGYFDSRVVPDQLGLQVVVQPCSIGPFAWGTSTTVQSSKKTKPGAFSITTVEARSDDEVQEIRELSRQTVVEMLPMEGFIGWVGMIVGHRMLTVTAWESPENPRQLLRGGTHKEAMTRVFRPKGLGQALMTSVWIPERIGALWVRCEACGHMADSAKADRTCDCGAALPEPMAYW
ncbi:MAG: ester cyclase [Betaproteobacteria bacterium]|nr:ester cyclase [Betaproteobacteria bacterium]